MFSVLNRKERTYIALIFTLCIFLSACGHLYQTDGPPPYDVDVSKIPNAVPKVEPLHRFANRPYSLRGQHYTIIKKTKGYRTRGVASWYGRQFQHHRTSSGERYNMFAMTAASRTLPIPSYAQVTNIENGRKVVVKINDRGPFEKNRIIDLSYVAAKKLGITARGTGPVEVRAIHPDEISTFASAESWSAPVYLQVGAFKNRLNADQLRTRIAKFIDDPIRISVKSHTYKVQIGPLEGKRKIRIANKLTHSGLADSITVIPVA